MKNQQGRPRLIGIAGPSCSGKSSVARAIMELLPESALIPVDSYYRDAYLLTELASDCEIDNGPSRAFHEAMGFEEVQRNIGFRRDLTR